MKQEVAELHELLKRAKENGPFVLVGHSYKGLLARLFAGAYPRDVAGVVLVDGTHESTVLSVQRRGEPQARWVRIREGSTGRAVPMAKLMENAGATSDDKKKIEVFIACLAKPGVVEPPLDRVPRDAQALEYCAHRHRRFSPQADNYWPDELQAMFDDRGTHPQPLESTPLSVLASGRSDNGIPSEILKEKEQQKEDMASLSSNSRFLRVADSGHHIHLENPAVVLNEIRDVIQAARKHQPLARRPDR